jgi:hypothetical protein
MDRRKFIARSGAATAGVFLINPVTGIEGSVAAPAAKKRLALVGTGVRGIGMYGRDLLRNYSQYVEMVALCDTNPGRLKVASGLIGAGCPVFTDLEEMIKSRNPKPLL